MNNQKPPEKKKKLLGYVYITILIALIAAGLIYLFKRYPNLLAVFTEQNKIREIITRHGVRAPFILIGLQVFQIIIAPIPGHIIGFVAGYLFGISRGIIYCLLGVVLGASITFWIGRIFGRKLLQLFISQENMQRFDRYVLLKGPFVIFILLLLPVTPLGDILFYLSGLTAMPFLIFLIMALIARLPSTVVNNLIGAKAFTFTAREWIFFLIVLIILSLLFYLSRKKIENIILRFVKY
jgi:uncharacterized membrane protein YdjX (TVP38/TMEM64 family)